MSKTTMPTKICQWCGGPLKAKVCAACKAPAPKAELEVPGLTSMSEELTDFQSKFEEHFAALKQRRIIQILRA